MLDIPNVFWIHSIPDVAGKMDIQQGYPSAARTDCRIFTTTLSQLISVVYDSDGLIASADTDRSL